MVTADHGPAVSGAHNTIVCARAGKDLVSSLASGLLTIVSSIHICSTCIADFWPHAGSGVVRTDLFRFLSRCHKRRLNQVLSYLLACFLVCCCLLEPYLCIIINLHWYLFCILVVLVKLSVLAK